MDQQEIIKQCPTLFSGSKGTVELAKKELQFVRDQLPTNDPLRFDAEFAFYRMTHTTTTREFKRQYSLKGPPIYAENVR